MANAVKALTTGMLIVGTPSAPFSGLAWNGILTKASPSQGRTSSRFTCVVVQRGEQLVSGGEEFVQGSPGAPSLRMDSEGQWRFRWVLTSGTHTLQVSVMQAANLTPRPALVVKANPNIGIATDIVGTAPAGAGWTTITVSATATTLGATWVELHNYLETSPGVYPCYWDHLIGDNGNILCDFDIWLEGAPVVFQQSVGSSGTPTTTFMAQKLKLFVRPVPEPMPAAADKGITPKSTADVEGLRKWCREAERAFRAIESAFNKATGN
jgi:hypothetical protein